ncbi:unnamed protein product [Ceutorhynchus assimilis]|uniref:Methylosome subunit pICln n=1 Tax=Ceutorhynchus assimilis TaxID=467358 RepID=A0A9N9QB93_9CUCU|nr:unnamed protein product [Ceutorhynchus assimilis]
MVILNSFAHPDSNIVHQQRNVRAILNKKDLGIGTLFISERTLCWQEKDDAGFSIGYPDVTLHAISKDETIYPTQCVYIMVDGYITMPGDESHIEEDSDDAESETEISEIILVPTEETSENLNGIYEAIKICQEKNPDPDDMDEDDDYLYEDAEEDHGDDGGRGAGGDTAAIDISRRMEEISVNINYNNTENGNDEEEFEDAD